MPDPVRFVYWDACIFLCYVNGDAGKLPDIDPYLDGNIAGVQLVTSVLSIAEVAFAKVEQDGKALDPAIEQKIDALWSGPDSPVKLIEISPLIAYEARALMRSAITNGWSLKASDAIHMASAKSLGSAEVHTYEGSWLKYSAVLGIPIRQPWVPQLTLAHVLVPASSADAPPSVPLWEALDAWPALEA